MELSEIIPTLLNPLVNGRVWYEQTPEVIPRTPAGDRFLDFVIWNLMGGQEVEYVGQTMGDKSNARIQIAVFSHSSIIADRLIRQVRDRLLASDYAVGVYGSPVGTYDTARGLRGRFQQYSIWYPTPS